VKRAKEELKGFQRITLQPNETKAVTLPVKAEDLAYWDEGKYDATRISTEPRQ
jgi:beta-glucosidase